MKNIYIAFFGLLFFGCNGSSDGSTPAPIVGTHKSSCLDMGGGDYAVATYVLSANNFRIDVKNYSTSDCSGTPDSEIPNNYNQPYSISQSGNGVFLISSGGNDTLMKVMPGGLAVSGVYDTFDANWIPGASGDVFIFFTTQ